MKSFADYKEKEMILHIKTDINQKSHNGDFWVYVKLLRGSKFKEYAFKVSI